MDKTCSQCKITKIFNDFYKGGKITNDVKYPGQDARYKDGYRSKCKECFKSNKNKYQQKNIKKFHKYLRNYVKIKRKINPIFRLKLDLRTRLSQFLKGKGLKKNKKTIQIIGCTWEELKIHIETQFKEGMTWENQGNIWQLDHIIPLGLAKTIDDAYKYSHYSNLKPLTIEEHRIKTKKDIRLIRIK